MARKRFSSEFKARGALEAVAQRCSRYEVHASQIGHWKRQARQRLVESFEHGGGRASAKEREALEERLYSQIGKLQVEVKWLRKKSRALGLL